MRSLVRSITIAALLAGSGPAAAQVPQAPTGPERQLPSSVLGVFRSAYPNATITGAEQERQDRRIVFRIECQDGPRRRALVYALDGSVVESAEQVNESELPESVRASMRSHRRVIFVRGMKVTRGTTVEYDLTVRGTRKTRMILKPDGTVVSFR